ncbi:NAD-dependent succinate-semialdehyde dehydrogenase [Pseudohoeflea coraliihabitans]|uniref:NAD-dependent succinate-semialdehyde dehydrogenase n=1 Tax=Pseudohoeflea coraliihabitans TaxID=2860393 RepID=A0ABS6WL15_9HYPH|nr:NAD-dependent succinate-semialdehyde dehydrogenase [Pseudohoeflea sp. DP4N28-3]MBW3096634.1 NAD-dependent succinate-semialdehyde dehydrogenase [Pseudohoeflea sp. DP4N28-3]
MTELKLTDGTLFTDRCLVDGSWITATDDGIAVTNPADGSLIATVPSLPADAIRRAIDAAHLAKDDWAARPVKERAALLHRWYQLILENADDLAVILSAEQGKPLAEARGEIIANAAYLEWFAEEAKRIYGDIVPPPARDRRVLVIKQPVGVCAAITPWNFPNGMITRKAGPALAAGCPIIVKPASQTPLSALALAVLAERAGIPAGVFQVVTGKASAIGTEFCLNPKIAKISFTGSTEVGRWLIRESAGDIKRLSLELGGNAPFIVFEDADLDAAVAGAMIAKFRNSGQTCVCANRIYVHRSLAGAFAARLAEAAARLKVGTAGEEGVEQGPLIDEKAVEKMEEHLADALAKGARLLTGGKRHARGGTFFEPTVLENVSQQMVLAREETFAPLAPVIPFDDEAEALAMANDNVFGLAGYFYTRDLARMFRVAEALECGIVGVNSGVIANEMAPFGGFKQSGIGREGSKYGIEEYLEIKYVCVAGL